MGPCQITKNQINFELIKIIQFMETPMGRCMETPMGRCMGGWMDG